MAAIAETTIVPTRSESRSAVMRKGEGALLALFITMIVVVAFPGKFLFYGSPGLLIGLSLMTGHFIRFWRLLLVVTGVACLSIFTMTLDAWDGNHVNWPGLGFGLITYLPIFILWCLSKDFEVSEALARRMATVIFVFIIVEVAIGAAQFAVIRDPDFVSGTLGLFDAVGRRTNSQINYGFNLVAMVVYCAMWLPELSMVMACTTALIGVVLSGTAHQAIFFVAMLPTVSVMGKRGRGLVGAVAFALVALGAFMLVQGFYGKTAGVAAKWYDRVLDPGSSPKLIAIEGALDFMPDPRKDYKNLIFGVGLGQYASRAADLTSGLGTSVSLPDFLVDASDYFDGKMASAIRLFQSSGEQSSMAMPYFSVLAVLTEFGPLFAAAFFVATLASVFRNFRLGRVDVRAERAAFYCNFFIGFLALCSCIQNYMELTQAIMIPIILYIICKGRLQALNAAAAAEKDAALPA